MDNNILKVKVRSPSLGSLLVWLRCLIIESEDILNVNNGRGLSLGKRLKIVYVKILRFSIIIA